MPGNLLFSVYVDRDASFLIFHWREKCTREDPCAGGNVMTPMRYPILNVTAFAWVLSDTFSLQWDIDRSHRTWGNIISELNLQAVHCRYDIIFALK